MMKKCKFCGTRIDICSVCGEQNPNNNAIKDALIAVLDSCGARGTYDASKCLDAENKAERVLLRETE